MGEISKRENYCILLSFISNLYKLVIHAQQKTSTFFFFFVEP